MKILTTGSNGFIAKNLSAQLRNEGHKDLLPYNRQSEKGALEELAAECDFVYRLAGANRPADESGFTSDNVELTKDLISLLERNEKKPPVVFSSSIHAEGGSAYGKSKLSAEGPAALAEKLEEFKKRRLNTA